jgi:hypothetical protein
MWKEIFCFGREEEIGGRGNAVRFVRRQVSRTVISYSSPLLCFAFLFLLQRSIRTQPLSFPPSPFWKTLETWISPFYSFPFSIPFFLFIFPQGCNTVSFRKERPKGKKTQFREIKLPAPPPLPVSPLWNFVYKLALHLSSFFLLLSCSPSQLI